MSFEAMTWAVKQDLPALQKLVLLLLANRHNMDTGRCMPSHDKLARDCGMSKTAVKSAINALADKGLLEIERRSDGSVNLTNQYLLRTDTVYECPASSVVVGRQTTHPVATRPMASDEPGGAPDDRGVGRQTTTKQEVETVIEPKKKKENNAPAISFDGISFQNISPEQISLWCEAYPAVDVKAEILKAAAWLDANPLNRKSDYKRFLNNWLSRSQDRAPAHSAGRSIHRPRMLPPIEDFSSIDYGKGIHTP